MACWLCKLSNADLKASMLSSWVCSPVPIRPHPECNPFSPRSRLQSFPIMRATLTTNETDVSMPVMTGYESTRHIRSVEIERTLAYEHQNYVQSPYLSDRAEPPSSFPFQSKSRSASSSISSSTNNSNSPSAFVDLHLSQPKLKLNRYVPPFRLSSWKDSSNE